MENLRLTDLDCVIPDRQLDTRLPTWSYLFILVRYEYFMWDLGSVYLGWNHFNLHNVEYTLHDKTSLNKVSFVYYLTLHNG